MSELCIYECREYNGKLTKNRKQKTGNIILIATYTKALRVPL